MWEKCRSAIGYSFFLFITDIPVSFFCDKNYKDYPDGFLGKSVISPFDLKKTMYFICVFIVIFGSSVYYTQCPSSLLNLDCVSTTLIPLALINYEEEKYQIIKLIYE